MLRKKLLFNGRDCHLFHISNKQPNSVMSAENCFFSDLGVLGGTDKLYHPRKNTFVLFSRAWANYTFCCFGRPVDGLLILTTRPAAYPPSMIWHRHTQTHTSLNSQCTFTFSTVAVIRSNLLGETQPLFYPMEA